MELKRAIQLRTEYMGNAGVIRVDADDYICLNEMAEFFPGQRVDNWLRSDKTRLFIEAVETEFLIPRNRGIIAKRGKSGGTWAHPMIAFEFATWLSPEFKLKVYKEYIDGTQHKKDWNIKRILAANNYKMLTKAIKDSKESVKPHHYSNEALLINEIVFGKRTGCARDEATEKQLDDVSALEQHNATMIMLGMEYQSRKMALIDLHRKSNQSLTI